MLSPLLLFSISWTVACYAPLSIISQSLPKFVSVESVMLSNHLILCCPLLLLPSVFPSIMIFSSELAVHIRWPKYWSSNFNISPSEEYSGLGLYKIDNHQGHTMYHRELYWKFCNNLHGKIWKRIDIFIYIAESLYCIPETVPTL